MVRHYTEQFKKDAIAYVRDHADLSVNTWAKNLGVSNSTLHNQIGKTREKNETHRVSGNHSSDEAKEDAS